MKTEFKIRFTKDYRLELVIHVLKEQRVFAYLITMLIFSLLYMYKFLYNMRQTHSLYDIVIIGVPSALTTIFFLMLWIICVRSESKTKVTLTDETLSMTNEGLSRDSNSYTLTTIPWSEFDGYSTSARLLYLRLKLKSRSQAGAYQIIPLSDFNQEALEFLKANVRPLSLSDKDYFWGSLAHLSALSMYITGIGCIMGPLIIWLWKRKSDSLVSAQAREALNFNISIVIYCVAAGALLLTGFLPLSGVHAVYHHGTDGSFIDYSWTHTISHGFIDTQSILKICVTLILSSTALLIFLALCIQFICIIKAGIAASSGRSYRYPLNLRLVKGETRGEEGFHGAVREIPLLQSEQSATMPAGVKPDANPLANLAEGEAVAAVTTQLPPSVIPSIRPVVIPTDSERIKSLLERLRKTGPTSKGDSLTMVVAALGGIFAAHQGVFELYLFTMGVFLFVWLKNRPLRQHQIQQIEELSRILQKQQRE